MLLPEEQNGAGRGVGAQRAVPLQDAHPTHANFRIRVQRTVKIVSHCYPSFPRKTIRLRIGRFFWTLVGRQSERQVVPPGDRYGLVHGTRRKDDGKVRTTMKANLDMAIGDIGVGQHVDQIPEDVASLGVGISANLRTPPSQAVVCQCGRSPRGIDEDRNPTLGR
jgi:hypothetical protein